MAQAERSYTDRPMGAASRVRELLTLFKDQRSGIPIQVGRFLEGIGASQTVIESVLGDTLVGKRVLILGPGQRLSEVNYFSARNQVIGVDRDFIPRSISIGSAWKIYRTNGGMRLVKTVGRRLAGIDRKYQRELSRQLGRSALGKGMMLTMDAGCLAFADSQFDVVYSHSCFEHLVDPSQVVDEVGRVLKPGGVARIELHLYTSDSGCHDVRIFANQRKGIPYWSHLRPEHASKVTPNAYLNKVRLHAWKSLFGDAWPGAGFSYRSEPNPSLVQALPELREQGELAAYADEELLTTDFIVDWLKPSIQ